MKKTGMKILLCLSSLGLSGCFELVGDPVGNQVDSPASPPPPSGNSAPVISGNPVRAIRIGDNYFFSPSAFDADGDPLTFSIRNEPGWANFDPATGTLSGVAVLGSEGIYQDIEISVSDGQASTQLPMFSVEVTQDILGSVTLTWTPQLENTDGTPLVDLTGYRLYYGTEQGVYPNQIVIDNPGVTTYVVDNLPPDTYFFVSTSVNSSGVESDFSNVANRTVN